MANRVFNYWLQDQVRRQGVGQRRRRPLDIAQAITEPDLFDGHVLALAFQLLGQGDHLAHVALQRPAQEAGKSQDHLLGPVVLPLHHQGRQGVEGVEQEVRADLVAQHAVLGLGGQHPRRLQLEPGFARRQVGMNRHVDRRPGREEPEHRPSDQHHLPEGRVRPTRQDGDIDGVVGNAEDQRADQ